MYIQKRDVEGAVPYQNRGETEPDSAAPWARGARSDEGVAPPENEKSTPLGVLRFEVR